MTITVTQPATSPVGWGVNILGTTDVGTPGGWMFISMDNLASGFAVCGGSAFLTAGDTAFEIVLGIMKEGDIFGPIYDGASLAHALTMSLVLHRADDSVVQSASIGGWTHDPVTGLMRVIGNALATIVNHDPMLDLILASVRTTYG